MRAILMGAPVGADPPPEDVVVDDVELPELHAAAVSAKAAAAATVA